MNHLQPLWFSFSLYVCVFVFFSSLVLLFLAACSWWLALIYIISSEFTFPHSFQIRFFPLSHLRFIVPFTQRASIEILSMPNETSKFTKSHSYIHLANEHGWKELKWFFAFEIDATDWFHHLTSWFIENFCLDFKFHSLRYWFDWVALEATHTQNKRQMKKKKKQRKKNETFYFEVKHARESLNERNYARFT